MIQLVSAPNRSASECRKTEHDKRSYSRPPHRSCHPRNKTLLKNLTKRLHLWTANNRVTHRVKVTAAYDKVGGVWLTLFELRHVCRRSFLDRCFCGHVYLDGLVDFESVPLIIEID